MIKVVTIDEVAIEIVEITSPSSLVARTFAFSMELSAQGSFRLLIFPVTKLR